MGLSLQPKLDNFELPEELVTVKYECDDELLQAECATDVENQTEDCPLQSYKYSDRPHVLKVKWQGTLRVSATYKGNTVTCGKDIPPYIGKINAAEKWRIEGFHVMSYQNNFAGHHTHDRHVGFLFAQSDIGKYNIMQLRFLFRSHRFTKLQLSDKNIGTHTWLKFWILVWRKSKVSAYFVNISLYYAIQKGNRGGGRNKIVCV